MAIVNANHAALQVEDVPIDDLRPDPANARRISDAHLEALTRSLKEFGFVQPVLVRHQDKTVIGGHQRLVAARRLGFKTVPVTFLDLTTDQARVLNLALNKISGEWDQELLTRMLADLRPIEEIDLSLTGFSEGELDKLLKSLDARGKRERTESFDLDAALEAARAAPRAQRGEIWQLGDHRLMCGDSTDAGDVARLLDGAKAAVAFTDPPYNVSLGDHGGQQRGQRRRRIQNDCRMSSGSRSAAPGRTTSSPPSTAPSTSACRRRSGRWSPESWRRRARTGATRSSGRRTALSSAAPTTSAPTSLSGTAGAIALPTIGAATATRAMSGASSGRAPPRPTRRLPARPGRAGNREQLPSGRRGARPLSRLG